MKEKGQLVSMDLMFSLILVALALGMTFRVAELNLYESTGEQQIEELRMFAENASDRLVHMDAAGACTLVDGAGIPRYQLPNCIDTSKVPGTTKATLGIPASHSILVQIVNEGIPNTTLFGTEPDPDAEEPHIRHKVAVTRWVTIQDTAPGNVDKADLLDCLDGGGGGGGIGACDFIAKKLLVQVWRTPP